MLIQTIGRFTTHCRHHASTGSGDRKPRKRTLNDVAVGVSVTAVGTAKAVTAARGVDACPPRRGNGSSVGGTQGRRATAAGIRSSG